jgi:hypothetical protein
MSMSSRQEVLEAVNGTSRSKSPSGATAYFVTLNEEWGIKVFDGYDERDEAHERQGRAAKHGLGPRVGECFDLPNGKYCYVTEVAETFTDGNNFDEEEEEDFYAEWGPECQGLLRALDSAEVSCYDDHAGNYGLLNGKLVFIDFG